MRREQPAGARRPARAVAALAGRKNEGDANLVLGLAVFRVLLVRGPQCKVVSEELKNDDYHAIKKFQKYKIILSALLRHCWS